MKGSPTWGSSPTTHRWQARHESQLVACSSSLTPTGCPAGTGSLPGDWCQHNESDPPRKDADSQLLPLRGRWRGFEPRLQQLTARVASGEFSRADGAPPLASAGHPQCLRSAWWEFQSSDDTRWAWFHLVPVSLGPTGRLPDLDPRSEGPFCLPPSGSQAGRGSGWATDCGRRPGRGQRLVWSPGSLVSVWLK